MNRKLLILIVTPLVGIVFLSAITIILLGNEKVSQYLISQAIKKSGNSLKIDRCQGSLLSGLKINAINLKFSEQHVFIEEADLDLNLFSLLKGTLHLRELEMRGLEYSLNGNINTVIADVFSILKRGLPQFNMTIEKVELHGLLFRGNDVNYNNRAITFKVLNS